MILLDDFHISVKYKCKEDFQMSWNVFSSYFYKRATTYGSISTTLS